MAYGTQAVQVAASGVAIPRRAYLRQVCTVHTASKDDQILLYDMTSTPGEGDLPHCAVPLFGKNIQTIPIPGDGLLFENGMYVAVPADATINIFYEEA
jgi:hypothetical protein